LGLRDGMGGQIEILYGGHGFGRISRSVYVRETTARRGEGSTTREQRDSQARGRTTTTISSKDGARRALELPAHPQRCRDSRARAYSYETPETSSSVAAFGPHLHSVTSPAGRQRAARTRQPPIHPERLAAVDGDNQISTVGVLQYPSGSALLESAQKGGRLLRDSKWPRQH
jgi:hypothetical protein